MSLKTRILLQRGGRDQFGDPPDEGFVYVAPKLSREERAEFHEAVAAFYNDHWPAWSRFCEGKTAREIWTVMFHPHGKPAFSTFEKQRRAFASLTEYLKYALVLYRWRALMAMGRSHEVAKRIISKYPALSRYVIEPQVGIRKPGRSPGFVARVE